MIAMEQYLENHSMITNKDAKKIGYSRGKLSYLNQTGYLTRVKQGLYMKSGEIMDDYKLISANNNIIFSNETALFLHDLSDRIPDDYTFTVKANYNVKNIKKLNSDIQVYYVKDNLFHVGEMTTLSPFGNVIPVYDLERTFCDIIMRKKEMDIQVYIDGIKNYFDDSRRDLNKLIHYSRLFGIEEKVRTYIEVLE